MHVTDISDQGFQLNVDGCEMFLPFERFPWFRNATVSAISTIQRPQWNHLYWPMIDVDLHLESIVFPEDYPLIAGPNS